ncbi:hypothetical protein ACWGH3_02780 [Streptomyces sp. NPDC054884]
MNTTDFAAAQWTRATGTGVDPHEYRRVTESLTTVADWGAGLPSHRTRLPPARGGRGIIPLSG